jgi:hypothetical protein
MKIHDINSNYTIDICCVQSDKVSVDLDITIIVISSETDSDMSFSTNTRLLHREIRYLYECYVATLKNDNEDFGFTSYDKSLVFYVNSKDLTHELILRDTRYNSQVQSQCKFYFRMTKDTVSMLCTEIKKFLAGAQIKENSKHNWLSSVCISFPDIVEIVNKDLCTCKIKVDSPFYHIVRKMDSSFNEINSLMTKIEACKDQKLVSFDILDDFLEIHFLRFDNLIDIQGEISDFTFPDPNEIIFHELVDTNILDKMYLSLEMIRGNLGTR